MPNWIPVLIVLLTQGASGTLATAQPHDMMWMLRMVAQWEEAAQEIQSSIPATSTATECGVLPTGGRSKKKPELVVASFIQFWPVSDLSRDGPSA